MTCTNCRTRSCYICREVITGYEHFTNKSDTSKCQLWDDLAKRHANEVKAAAKKATEEVQREEKIKKEMRDKKVHVSKFRLLSPIKGKLRANKIAA